MAPPGKIEALGTGYQFRAAATLAQMRSARFLRLSAGRLAGFWLGGSRLYSWPVHDISRWFEAPFDGDRLLESLFFERYAPLFGGDAAPSDSFALPVPSTWLSCRSALTIPGSFALHTGTSRANADEAGAHFIMPVRHPNIPPQLRRLSRASWPRCMRHRDAIAFCEIGETFVFPEMPHSVH